MSWLMAPLVAAYGPWCWWPLRPATEEKKTMRPSPCSRMPGATAWAVWNALDRLTATMRSQSPAEYSSIARRSLMPTQCTKTSMPPPRAARASAAAAWQDCASRRSAATRARTPSGAAAGSRSITATCAPASRKPSTSAAPIVPAPPATTTRRPSSPSQPPSGTRRLGAVGQHVDGHARPVAGDGGRVRRAARQCRGLARGQAHRLTGDDEVDRPRQHGGDLVLRVLVLLPARPRRVAVQRRGELRRVHGGAGDAGAHLGEVALVPVDLHSVTSSARSGCAPSQSRAAARTIAYNPRISSQRGSPGGGGPSSAPPSNHAAETGPERPVWKQRRPAACRRAVSAAREVDSQGAGPRAGA